MWAKYVSHRLTTKLTPLNLQINMILVSHEAWNAKLILKYERRLKYTLKAP